MTSGGTDCVAVSESMPLLLTESLDAARREAAHQHIESCALCSAEWSAHRETWAMMGDLPEVEVPARVKTKFLERAGLAAELPKNVVPFHRKPAFKWVAQAAAVVLLAGGGYFAGAKRVDTTIEPSPATIAAVEHNKNYRPVSLAETRVLDAETLSDEIQGRPNISNLQFLDADASDQDIAVSFDVTSRWTVNGNPRDKSMVRLLSYILEHDKAGGTPRSDTLEWVRQTYSDPAYADPEIARSLAKVLRNDDQHEGMRIRAIETLTTLPPSVASQTRDALIDALKSDPNPAVRIKAVEALANMTRSGTVLDPAMVDTLRQKAAQGDENVYVRVKAAEALSNIKP
ncbi:MAG TPA: HEAT repeat domain-containing protein [Thermoanaerobaculia bacterium]|nr:HEAT repeat domain-containing protein [Thermoanaerobaculia bacterium]